jgi:hypothetical protein
MKFVMLVYQGSTPLPGSDRWQALPEADQKAIYADYAELNKTEGVAPGLPLGLPDGSRTVQVRDGETRSRTGRIWRKARAGTSCTKPRAWKPRSPWLRGSRRPGWAAP